MNLDIMSHGVALLPYALMASIVAFAIGAIVLNDLMRAAFCLGAIWILSGLFFMVLGQEMLGVFQIIIYAGAVLSLLLFSVMLTDISEKISSLQSLPLLGFATAVSSGLVLVLIKFSSGITVSDAHQKAFYSIQDLGKSLVQNYAFPFEWISITLVAVMVSALTLARKDQNRDSR